MLEVLEKQVIVLRDMADSILLFIQQLKEPPSEDAEVQELMNRVKQPGPTFMMEKPTNE